MGEDHFVILQYLCIIHLSRNTGRSNWNRICCTTYMVSRKANLEFKKKFLLQLSFKQNIFFQKHLPKAAEIIITQRVQKNLSFLATEELSSNMFFQI